MSWTVEVSATKEKTGLDKLLEEAILLQAEVMELGRQPRPQRSEVHRGRGESSKSGRGAVTTVLVQKRYTPCR